MSDNIQNNTKNKKNVYKITAIIIGIVVFGCLVLNNFTKKDLYNGKISKNIFIQGIDISNMTKEEAIKAVEEKYNVQDLTLQYNDKSYIVGSKDIELNYNTKELVDKAYNSTRTGSYFNDITSYMKTKINGKEYSIKATYNEKELDKILNDISNSINQKAMDAIVNVGSSISYIDSKTGLKFETEENKKLVTEALDNKKYENIDLKVTVTQPKVSTDDVKSINTCLASFSTTFNAALIERSYNIGLAAQRCSNVILLPGETYSYNKQTGVRLISNGFKNAPVIVGGELVDAPGGGVCQTSTTMFNAALLSGLQIDQVRNHSKTSHYAQRGRDAMVNDSGSDLKFTNNFDHAVYIECYRSGNTVNAAIYGAYQDKVNVSIDVDNFVYNGLPGAKTYRTITKNGKSKKSFIYTSVYNE